MKIIKHMVVLLLQVLLSLACYTQSPELTTKEQEEQIYRQHTTQRKRIDSLKKVLPSLKDSAQIDCLNTLSSAYIPNEPDTARVWALQALKEAGKLNYRKGHGAAYSCLGHAARWISDFPAAEKYYNNAITLLEQTQDSALLASAYLDFGNINWYQSKFSEAIRAERKALQLYRKAGNQRMEGETYIFMGYIEQERGYYGRSIQYFLKGRELTGETSYANLADLYRVIGDYETALIYDRELFEKKGVFLGLIETFYHLKQYDSAFYYSQLFIKYLRNYYPKISLGKPYSRLGELYTVQKKYDTALVYLNSALKDLKKANDRNQVMETLLRLSKTYKEKGDEQKALQKAQELFQLANETGARQHIRDAHFLLYELFERQQKRDSAYVHLRQYSILKDSIDKDLTAQKLAFYKTQMEREKAQARINILDKEKRLQQQQLKQTALQKKLLLAGVATLLLFGVFIFRNILMKRRIEKQRLENKLELQQLESKKTKVELQHQATELEMQALRAQMNPHFIFNSLNSINRFILQNNKAQASEYLTKFSRLIRLILQNSQAALIPLESELESLKLYLELEAARFDHHFEFKIKVDDELDTDIIKVPPLIIQPYAENAIWHGLMTKEEKGHLEIELFQKDNVLCCKITDDGIGRKKAMELKSKSASTHKSMGMQITTSRIEMLQQKKQLDVHIKIADLVLADGSAAGTEVLIQIPLMHD